MWDAIHFAQFYLLCQLWASFHLHVESQHGWERSGNSLCSSSDAGSSLVTLNSLKDYSAFMNPMKSYMLPAVFPGYNILKFSKGVSRSMDQFDAKSMLSFLNSRNERFGHWSIEHGTVSLLERNKKLTLGPWEKQKGFIWKTCMLSSCHTQFYHILVIFLSTVAEHQRIITYKRTNLFGS